MVVCHHFLHSHVGLGARELLKILEGTHPSYFQVRSGETLAYWHQHCLNKSCCIASSISGISALFHSLFKAFPQMHFEKVSSSTCFSNELTHCPGFFCEIAKI